MTEPAARALDSASHLVLIDASGYIFRAYHALPPLSRPSDNLPTGAVAGFCAMVHKLFAEIKAQEATHIAAVFDAAGPSFRRRLYPAYKANRAETPADLIPQFPLIRRAARAFGLAAVEQTGLEADDIIAAYARRAREKNARVSIISSDKDLMQLVGDKVVMIDTMKERVIGPQEVVQRFGVPPAKVVDVQALAGDSSDNIPGAPGIGVKTAALLINQYGDLESLLARAGEIKQPKRRQTLIEAAGQIRLSRRLALLNSEAEPQTPLEALAWHPPDPEALVAFLREMEFRTLTARIAKAYGAPASPASPRPGIRVPQAASEPIDTQAYETITDPAALENWIAAARVQGRVVVDVETDSLDAMRARLVGLALALAPGRAAYLPLLHEAPPPAASGDLLADKAKAGRLPGQIASRTALALLKPLLEDPGVLKIAHNAKYDLLVLRRHGIALAPVEDTMLLSYSIDAGHHGHGMDELSRRHLEHQPISFKQVAGAGKKAVTFEKVPLAQAAAYAGEDADITARLHQILRPRLLRARKVAVYETLERPLIPVLAGMEEAGVRIDAAALSALSREFARRLEGQSRELRDLAGADFNPASARQVGELLFDKMGLPSGRKTRTGQWSTEAGLLEELAVQGHDLPARILDWRHLAKLKSTYSDALPGFVNPQTGRVHTSYAMAAAATGRLASSDPNLQNIPIRTNEGRRIRRAFIAGEGRVLISADYSQIELRLLAHIAGVEALTKAFARGEDIHAMTAAEMFGGAADGIDPAVRRRAKAVNFGIIYGISPFGLAHQLGIGRGEASDYIQTYFRRFPGIKDYMEAIKAQARRDLYVETIFGRRCHLPRIKAREAGARGLAERAAINAPVQGAAADIIKRAMIRMPQALARAGLAARMILQVHDELIFEAPEEEAAAAARIIREVMTAAPEPALRLNVPLEVEIRAAHNWEDAH